jgi:hypothetical protein
MAVVQISRIQVRRGKENSGSGLPQLASGEMAWSIDAQNLWIGNGSVAEGAPYVGNTKILTQNDLGSNGNILDLITYQYKKNDFSIVTGTAGANFPFIRDIQQKLDEVQTSVTDFGALGDGITDDTAAIQLAINQLFLNEINLTDITSRVTLYFPAGTYIITSTLSIPSYASLVGAGKDKTIIQFEDTNTVAPAVPAVVQFVNDTSTPGNPKTDSMPVVQYPSYNPVGSAGTTIKLSRTDALTGTTGIVPGMVITGTGFISGQVVLEVVDSSTIIINLQPDTTPSGILTFTATIAPAPTYLNQPRNIRLANMTLFSNTNQLPGMKMYAVRDSNFENLIIKGAWAQDFYETSIGISMTAFSRLVSCQRNVFINVDITRFSYALVSDTDIQYNIFQNSYVSDVRTGIQFGKTSNLADVGQEYGPSYNDFDSCHFENVRDYAVYVYNGNANTTRDCRLNNVGNDGGSNVTTALYPQIFFAVPGNASINTQSDRTKDLATSIPSVTTTYNPSGSSGVTLKVASTLGIRAGMVISGVGYTSSQKVTTVVNSTTLTMSAGPNSTPSGQLIFSIPYYPEVSGRVSYQSYGSQTVALSNISSAFAFRLPVPTDYVGYVINYVYKGATKSRRGHLTIMVDVTGNSGAGAVQVSDEYDYTGPSGQDDLLQFSASIVNNSLNVSYSNSSDAGIMSYSYTAIL